MGVSEAATVEGDDGFYYRNGDPNFLVIDNGNAYYTVADLKSAYLDLQNPSNIVVISDTYTCSYRKEEIVNRCKWLLIEEIRTGDVYHDGRIYYRKSNNKSYNIMHGKIYRKLKQSAMRNRNN